MIVTYGKRCIVLKTSCNFLPNVIDGHIGSEDIADLFSSKFEQLYNSVGFDEDIKK